MKRRIVIVFISILLIIISAIVGLFAYLQLSLFSVEPIVKSALSVEVSKGSINSLTKEDFNHYNALIPYKAVNDEITERFIQLESTRNRTVVSAKFDVFNKFAYLNYRKGNIYIPVYAKVLIESTSLGMNISVIPLSYGTKQLDLPSFVDNIIFHDLFIEPLEFSLVATDFFEHEYLTYESSELNEKGLQVNYVFGLPYFETVFKQIEEGLDLDFIDVYREGTPTQKESIQWIDLYSTQPDVILGKVFEDYKNKGPIIKDLLALVKPSLLDQIYGDYPLIESLVPRAIVDRTRIDLNGNVVLKYGQKILKTYDKYIKDKTIVYVNHQPFDYTQLEGISIELLNEYDGFDFATEFLTQFKLTEKDNVVNVLYTNEDGIRILLKRNEYKVLTQAEYESDYADPINPEGEFQVDTSTYEAIYYALFNLYQSDVFFRYLKDDGNEAFAIVSKVSDYQNFDVVALTKKSDSSYKVIDYGIISVETFHKKHPDFNLNLVTRIFENTTLLLLNGKTKTNIFEGVVERGYATDGEQMVYCSYDGNKYISIMLSSGEKYIYTLYRGSFLEELYPLDEALQTFSDIPPIILIQDIPGANIIN